MPAKRDNTFPSTSISRVQGAHIIRSPSHETLSAHPLLSPNHSTTNLAQPSTESTATATAATPASPRYVPYTPRQRVAPPPSAPTTGTTTTFHPSISTSPQPLHHGDATSKLQLMNLKAAAQGIGLDTSTVGWAILEALVAEPDHEWTEIWAVLTTGKATLLLPLEQASNDKLTPEFVRDHVLLSDGSAYAPVVTLSGLRGIMEGGTLTFRSSLGPASKSFQSLLTPATRATTLAALPPLPVITAPNIYPTFTLPSFSPGLPLPPRIVSTPKPPLPPRPAARAVSGATSRLGNPFASLFGKPAPAAVPTPASPSPSVASSLPDVEHGTEIAAFTVERRVLHKDIARTMNKALRGEVKAALAGVPASAVDRVHDATVLLYPFVKAPRGDPQAQAYVVNPGVPPPGELAAQFQEFYAVLEADLKSGKSFLARRREREEAEDDEKRAVERAEGTARTREIMETVERAMCTLFYDRLFLQDACDDASHDEALASRVAALNMLDLTLEHLDVHVGTSGPALARVVRACGDTLTRLDTSCRSPGEHAAVLVAAHKAVVDGLSRMPLVRLKSEGEEHLAPPLSSSQDGHPDGESDEQGQLSPLSPLPVVKVLEPDSDPISGGGDMVTSPDGEAPSSLGGAAPSPSGAAVSSPTPSRSNSPLPTPVSGDLLLPLIIFSVVKSNPPHLVSHLLYTQRFRNESIGGEESYCLINLMAVAEFLENVDLAALGLGDSDKVISTADLTPIPINRSPVDSPMQSHEGIPGSLRGRVEQQVDAIAGSANKVISGVVDSSFGILRSLLPAGGDAAGPAVEPGPWTAVRPGFGLLRRESGFSIASLAASLPGRGARSTEEAGQQLLTVSRPASVRALSVDASSTEDSEGSEEEDGESEEESGDDAGEHDTRSIRSFESMLTAERRAQRSANAGARRKSLSDRLAHMSGLAALKGSPPASRRSSLQPPASAPAARFDTPVSSRAPSPVPAPAPTLRLAPPRARFLECAEDDLRMGEVAELLREYRRVVAGVRAVGGFDE